MASSTTLRSLLRLLILSLLLLHPCHGREVVIKQSTAAATAATAAPEGYSHRRLHGSGVHREFYCSLQGAPIKQVAMNETTGKVYEVNDTTIDDTTTQETTYAVKPCACYRGLLNNTSYCPADSTYCQISVAYNYHYSYITSRTEDHDPAVACFRDTQLKGFARYVFKYCTIIMAALFIVLCFTDTGRVSMFVFYIFYLHTIY